MVAPVLSFQIHRMSRVGRSGVLENSLLWSYRIRQTESSLQRISHKTLLNLSTGSIPTYSKSKQQNQSLERQGKSRDMASLAEWSRSCGIALADGIELTEDLLGDWSLSTTKSIEPGTSILTVPSEMILTSDINGDSQLPYYNEIDMQNVRAWMKFELETGPQAKQDYLPEYMLVYKLIQEVFLNTSSRWYPWIQSLPTQFSTGLFLDDVERSYAERMTDYLRVQGSQYQACLEIFQKLPHVSQEAEGSKRVLIPTKFREWMLSLQQDSIHPETCFDSLVKWAFTIVFTRSWRSPDKKQAQIVPVGDLANHDSQFANLKPGFRKTDDAFQFFVTNAIDIDVAAPAPKLYLSYGLTYSPARFLVLFGFCDVTAAFIDAKLDFVESSDDDKWPTILEPSQLVVSTLNGALSEEVWIAFLCKMLEENDPDTLLLIRDAFDDDSRERGEKLVEKELEKWELKVGMEIKAHYEKLLETDFMPIDVGEKDLVEHPNLSMIVNYNLFMRETYLRVLEHINLFLAQGTEFQQLSTPKVMNANETNLPRPIDGSTPDLNCFLSEQSNQTMIASINDSGRTESQMLASTQRASSELIKKDSADLGRDNTVPLPKSPNITNSTTNKKEGEKLNTESSSFTENRDLVSYPIPESQDLIDSDFTSGSGYTSQMPSSRAVPNNPSRFSYDNFSLQSYNVDSDTNSYSFDGSAPEDNEQQASPVIPTGNFNPQFYYSSKIAPGEETTDSIWYEEFEPQIDYDATTDSSYWDSNSNSYALDELSQQNIESSTYWNSDSQYFSNDYVVPIEGSMDSNANVDLPNVDSYPQSFFFEQPSQQQIDYGNSNLESFSDGQTTSTHVTIDSTAAPGIKAASMGSQSPADGQMIGNTGLLSRSIIENGSPIDGTDLTTSYAQSLVSDQRSDSKAQRQSNENTIPSTPTTYAEYVQQRQAGSLLASEKPSLDEAKTTIFPLDRSQ